LAPTLLWFRSDLAGGCCVFPFSVSARRWGFFISAFCWLFHGQSAVSDGDRGSVWCGCIWGRLAGWPRAAKLLLPLLVTMLLWCLLNPAAV